MSEDSGSWTLRLRRRRGIPELAKGSWEELAAITVSSSRVSRYSMNSCGG